MISGYLLRNRSAILYGCSLAALLLLMRWLEWRFIILNYSFELYAGSIALLFTGLGIWLALKLARPKINTIIIEKEVFIRSNDFTLNQKEMAALGLSKRELEVLQLMAEGFSNDQIAERLFVSVNTIKTHSSKLFEKLEVNRRTHAVDKARKLSLIA